MSLPAPPTPLVGRDAEAREVLGLMSARDSGVRLLTLTGPAGVGKTRLAQHVGAELQRAGAFEGGVTFVDLAPLAEPSLVGRTIARHLGLREAVGRSLEEVLQDHLREQRPALLILDNFEQVLDAAGLVADLLAACSELRVLATSRAPLRLRWEREYLLPPLSTPEAARVGRLDAAAALDYPAVALFAERARAADRFFSLTDENAETVAEVCRRLDGLPLALELVATRVKVLSPRALLARLDAPAEPALRTDGPHDLPLRQRTLQAAIGWSYDLLVPKEQALFRRLAVFAGGCTLEAAEAVCQGAGTIAPSPSPSSVLALLASLVDKSLLQAVEEQEGERRFRLLETLRQFGLGRLEAHGEADEAQQRHATLFLALAERAEAELWGPRADAWLARLEREHDNLRAALRWSLLEGGRRDVGLRLAVGLWRFWAVLGHLGEGQRWLEEVLAHCPEAPVGARANALSAAANLARDRGDYARARALLEQAVALLRRAGEPGAVAMALNSLAIVAQLHGDQAQAAACCEEALGLLHELGDRAGVALLLVSRGMLARQQGDLARAVALHQESLALLRDLGDARGVAGVLNNLGNLAAEQGDRGRARASYQESLGLYRELGDQRETAASLGHLAALARDERDWRAAGQYAAESLALFAELGDRRGVAAGLQLLASVAAATHQPTRAGRLLGAAQTLRAEAGLNVAAGRAAEWTAGVDEAAFAAGRRMTLEEAVAYVVAPEQKAGPPAVSHPLTRREREVAALVARGLSNKQIAEALVIGERTVETHTANLLSKLGVASRAQVAAWAVQQGLLGETATLGPAPR